jgi:hypothetical protein
LNLFFDEEKAELLQNSYLQNPNYQCSSGNVLMVMTPSPGSISSICSLIANSPGCATPIRTMPYQNFSVADYWKHGTFLFQFKPFIFNVGNVILCTIIYTNNYFT